MSADEQRIREFAYQIWESEGKPHGHAKRHWDMARKLVEAEQAAPAKPPANKRAAKAKLPVDAPTTAKPRARKSISPVEAEIPVKPKPAKSKPVSDLAGSPSKTTKPKR